MRNIIIAGGGLVNKGAQAMTLISICELKKRFPKHRIYLLVWNTGAEERARYADYDFELLKIPPMKFLGASSNFLKRVHYTIRYGKTFTNIDEIYRHTDLFLDISGYALGSNWPAKVCNDYLDNIEFALAYNIPVYLMPQSFGPFDYFDKSGQDIAERTRLLFPKVKCIYAREQEGYESLTLRYGLSNVEFTNDMVLASQVLDYTPALKRKTEFFLPNILENSMCLIPNVRIGDRGTKDIEKLYNAAIESALSLNMNVYITHHSTQDQKLCATLKSLYAENSRVILLEHDFSCMEFNELVRRFCFVVGSRFHAIVHALKNGIPCIAFGWAAKYVDLLKLFNQEQFVFDLRETINIDDIYKAVERMAVNWQKESIAIFAKLPQVQKENVFDSIKKV